MPICGDCELKTYEGNWSDKIGQYTVWEIFLWINCWWKGWYSIFNEEEGEAKLAFTMEKDTDEYFKDNPEIFDKFIDYVQQCLVVANYAGFEAPSEFYTAIKAYVESEGDGILWC